MKKTIYLLAIASLVIAVYSCKKNAATGSLTTTAKLVLPETTEMFFTNGNFMTNNFDSLNRVATLGKVLFYDDHLSINNAISCGSCHKQALGFADNAAFSTGFEGRPTGRNSKGFSNLNSFTSLFWDGRENNLSNLAIRPLTNHVEMGITDPAYLPAKLGALPYYGKLFSDAFGDNTVTQDRISGAIATFMMAITSRHTRFQDFQNGDLTAMTAQEVEGRQLFDTKYNCGSCHIGGSGGYGGGQSFRDIGLDNGGYTDLGRGKITGMAGDNGTFLVPNLTNVALTAPYMHDGRYKTLDDVMEHYSHNIMNTPNLDTMLKGPDGKARTMNISDNDKKAIIAFLNTLTDYTMITDPKFSNPFKAN